MKKKGMIILCISLLLYGCSAGPVPKDYIKKNELKVGICVYDQYDTFISTLVECFQTAAKEKEQETGKTITVEVASAGGKQNIQNDQVADFIENNYDVLCVNLVDRTDATLVIDKAKSAGVPVIFFNRELVKEDLGRWNELYYVGSVASETGIFQGQAVVELCSGPKGISQYDKNKDGILQYVMLEGEAGHQDALIRTEYAIKTITESGIPLEKLGDEIANWSRDQAQTKMNAWLEEFGDSIELVLSNNDDMALGAIDAWGQSGKTKWPIIVGTDGMEDAFLAIKNGTMYATVLNDSKGQANSMLQLAYSLCFDTKLPEDLPLEDGKYIRLPSKIITMKNIGQADQYMEEK